MSSAPTAIQQMTPTQTQNSSTSTARSSDGGEDTFNKNTIPAITGNITYENPLFTLPRQIEPYKSGILSYSASFVSTTIGFPLDSIKTRMQTHHFNNTLDCFRLTMQTEGFRGFFRGIAAPLVSTSFSRSFAVSVYTTSKPIVAEIGSSIWGNEPIVKVRTKGTDQQQQWDHVVNNIPIALISGSLSGFMVSLFACPFELTKIFQQILILVNHDSAPGGGTTLKYEKLPTGLIDVGKNIIKYEGVSGLYSGFRYHFLRDGFSSGLFYGLYETVKLMIQNINDRINTTEERKKIHDSIQLLSVPMAGAAAGCFSWITVFPIDTMKSQYQRDVVGNILRKKSGQRRLGLTRPKWRLPTREMYKGLGPSITRSITTTMIFFSLFEYLMQNIA